MVKIFLLDDAGMEGMMEHSARKLTKEKRRHIRVDFATRVVINAGSVQIEVPGDSRDLSLKGVFINTEQKLPVDTRCSVRIFLSCGFDEVELKMKAKVARVDDHGLGISFDSMDLDTYTHLRNIMRYNADNFNEI